MSQLNDSNFFKLRDFRSAILQEYEKRKLRRPSYSIRAFARDLKINPITLTSALNKHHGISRKMAQTIAERLGFDQKKREFFCDLVESQHARTESERKHAKHRLKNYRDEFYQLNEEQISLLSHWSYPAVLEVVTSFGSKMTAEEIGRRLGLTTEKVDEALQYLKQAKLIRKTPSGFVSIDKHLLGDGPVPSKVVREWHHQLIELSKNALERQPIPKRRYLSSVFGIDSARVEEARQWLDKRHQEFLDEFVTNSVSDCVYGCSTQFFQIDDGDSNEI